jgi:hypothetical protein
MHFKIFKYIWFLSKNNFQKTKGESLKKLGTMMDSGKANTEEQSELMQTLLKMN